MFNKTAFFKQAGELFGHKGSRSSKASCKKIAPIGLTKDEVTLLASMVSIVAIKTQDEWQLGTVDDSELFFVNIESKEGASFVRRHDGQFAIIQYGKNKRGAGLAKPLRARDLLAALKSLNERSEKLSETITAEPVVPNITRNHRRSA